MGDDEVELAKLDDSIDEVEREKYRKGAKGKNKKDEGFGGTGLSGWHKKPVDKEGSQKDTPTTVTGIAPASSADLSGGRAFAGLSTGSLIEADDFEDSDSPIESEAKEEEVDAEMLEAIVASENGEMEIDGTVQKSCPSCTFLQSALNDECEICQASLK